MAAKILIAVFAQAVLIQCVLSNCIRNPVPAISPIGPSCGYNPPASGGGFLVTSASPIAPTGITIISENSFEGPLTIGGNLPFLATVALEGALPTSGAGAVSYGCGQGSVGIVSEGPVATGILNGANNYGASFGPANNYGASFGPGFGFAPGLLNAPGGLLGTGLGNAPAVSAPSCGCAA